MKCLQYHDALPNSIDQRNKYVSFFDLMLLSLNIYPISYILKLERDILMKSRIVLRSRFMKSIIGAKFGYFEGKIIRRVQS